MKGTFIVCISENIHKWTLKATTRISCKMKAKSCILIKDALKNLIFCYFTLFLAPPAARIFFFFFLLFLIFNIGTLLLHGIKNLRPEKDVLCWLWLYKNTNNRANFEQKYIYCYMYLPWSLTYNSYNNWHPTKVLSIFTLKNMLSDCFILFHNISSDKYHERYCLSIHTVIHSPQNVVQNIKFMAGSAEFIYLNSQLLIHCLWDMCSDLLRWSQALCCLLLCLQLSVSRNYQIASVKGALCKRS